MNDIDDREALEHLRQAGWTPAEIERLQHLRRAYIEIGEEDFMAHRHPMLYTLLSLVFLAVTAALIFIDVVLDWPSSTHAALFILSVFPLVLALVYFYLGIQEGRGF